jgi:serine/threonine protein kinase
MLVYIRLAMGGSGYAGGRLHEILAMGELRHPNVVSIFDAGDFEGSIYVVTELLDPDSLFSRMTSPVRIGKY